MTRAEITKFIDNLADELNGMDGDPFIADRAIAALHDLADEDPLDDELFRSCGEIIKEVDEIHVPDREAYIEDDGPPEVEDIWSYELPNYEIGDLLILSPEDLDVELGNRGFSLVHTRCNKDDTKTLCYEDDQHRQIYCVITPNSPGTFLQDYWDEALQEYKEKVIKTVRQLG